MPLPHEERHRRAVTGLPVGVLGLQQLVLDELGNERRVAAGGEPQQQPPLLRILPLGPAAPLGTR